MFSLKKSAIIMFSVLLFSITAATVYGKTVPAETAENVALNWIGEKTRAKFGEYAVSRTFAEYEKDRSAYYILNLDPEGWVIVSADDIARPIIAYSVAGAYSPDNRPPAFDEWMTAVKQAIYNAIAENIQSSAEISDEWLRLTEDPTGFLPVPKGATRGVAPLVQTRWGQDFPYNEQTPYDDDAQARTVTGCVATAMAQIMRYHEYPTTGYGSHSYVHDVYGPIPADGPADFGGTVYDWTKMPYATAEYDTQDEIDEVARLFFHCGVSVDMDYGVDGSSADMENDGRDALKNFFKYQESLYTVKKEDYTDEEWKSLLKADLDNQLPMLYAGPGHAFICDGYDDTDMFHFNFGWEGYEDGYFLLSGLIAGGYDFSVDQSAVIRIQPAIEPNLVYPYNQGFEDGLPDEWILSGERAGLSALDAHTGTNSILLSHPEFSGENINIAALKINVPADGGVLIFWVKRGYDSISGFNKQTAQIRPQFGQDVLETVFEGDFNDNEWQQFVVNLTPWKSSIITLYLEQYNAVTTPPTCQWMYIDDVQILVNEAPEADFAAENTEACMETAVKFKDLSSFFPTSWNWSFPGGNPSTSSEKDPSVVYENPGMYSVSLTATNDIGPGNTETKYNYIAVYESVLPACDDIQTQNLDQDYHTGIYRLKLNMIDSQTGSAYEDTGAMDFSCTRTTPLLPDTDYTVSVTVGDWNEELVYVYIDYNGDGDFDDAGENVFSSPVAKTLEHTGIIHTPENPLMDTLLRMRVISDVIQINACDKPFYGQVEDYGVVFKSGDLMGDVNDDKSINLADAVYALRIMADISSQESINPDADVNGDGKIGMQEVMYIFQKISVVRAD